MSKKGLPRNVCKGFQSLTEEANFSFPRIVKLQWKVSQCRCFYSCYIKSLEQFPEIYSLQSVKWESLNHEVRMAGLPPPGYGQQHHGVSSYPTQVADNQM